MSFLSLGRGTADDGECQQQREGSGSAQQPESDRVGVGAAVDVAHDQRRDEPAQAAGCTDQAGHTTDPARVGGVTGLVGAAGGLGGFVPPLIMGYVYGHTDSYAIGLWLLSITAALTLVLTATVVRRTASQQAVA